MSPNASNFTGFLAHYDNGKVVRQKENYVSKKLGGARATNWAEIDKKKLTVLELIWHGESKIRIDKEDYPHIGPDDWFFTHSAYYDMASRSFKIIGRNIGYRKDKVLQVYTVVEDTGILKSSVRNA